MITQTFFCHMVKIGASQLCIMKATHVKQNHYTQIAFKSPQSIQHKRCQKCKSDLACKCVSHNWLEHSPLNTVQQIIRSPVKICFPFMIILCFASLNHCISVSPKAV
uniref:Uncharacterized protein n=1 Tax=Sphaerodactylus townsendi TaxID=933632 RepID=A0ACB8ERB4_9SAUR